MQRVQMKIRAILVAVLLTPIGASGAIGDNGGPEVDGGHSHPHSASLPAAKIEAFASAATQIDKIGDRYMPKIKAAREAGDKEQMREHAGQAQREMTRAIQAIDGISVTEYQRIARRAREDSDLAAAIRRQMSGSDNAGSTASDN